MNAGIILALVGVGILVLTVILLFVVARLRNRRTGASGFVQRSRLTCPQCHQTFDYDWAPGAALNAVRLGTYRYFACPLCHKWSFFDVWTAADPSVDPRGSTPPPAPSGHK